MDALVFAANFMYVAAYFTSNMLRLRLLTLTAASCLAVYFTCQAEPMLTVVGWNLFFVALNLVQVARIVRARQRTPSQAAPPNGNDSLARGANGR